MSDERLACANCLEDFKDNEQWIAWDGRGISRRHREPTACIKNLRLRTAALEEQLQAARVAIDTCPGYPCMAQLLRCGVAVDRRPADPLTPTLRLELADMLAQFRRIKDSDKLDELESALRGGR